MRARTIGQATSREEPEPIDRLQPFSGLDSEFLEQFTPLARIVGLLLIGNAFLRIAFGDPGDLALLIRGGGSTIAAVLTLGLAAWLRSGRFPVGWVNPIGFAFTALVALTSLACAPFGVDPITPACLVGLLLAIGLLLPSAPWTLAAMAVVGLSWELIARLEPSADSLGQMRAVILGAALAGWALRGVRVRLVKRIPCGRSADNQQRQQFSIALELAHAELRERRRSQEAQQAQANRLHDLADRVPACLFVTDADGACLFVNRTWRQFTGLSAEQSAGLGWQAAIHPDDRPACTAAHLRAVRQGVAYHVEVRYRRGDGEYRWYLARALPLHDADGQIARWFGIATDIDEHKQAMEELQRSRRLFQQIAEAFPTILYVHDVDRQRNSYLSPSVRAALGFTREQIGSDLARLVVDPADRPTALSAPDYLGLADGQVAVQVLRCRHADGSIRTLQCREVVLNRHPDGRPREILGHALDVTEQLRSEDLLRASSRRKEEFLTTMAHELRNPLAAIVNAAEILGSEDLAEQHEWARGIIDRQARQLARLADDLLDFARISRGLIQMVRADVDLVRVVRDSVETIRPQAAELDQTIVLDLAPEPLWIDGDATRLEQIFVNLLRNAVKFSDPGGRIVVSASREGDEALITVRDDGMGIAAEDLPRLFDLFAQASLPRGRSNDGLGLGLSLVKSLTELHGGTVRVQSEGLRLGSQFILRFPLRPAQSVQLAPQSLLSAAAPTRILLVDDNSGMAQAMAELLRHAGHDPRIAPDGQSALALVSDFLPELILLDVELPDIDGYEVARRLRKTSRCSATPIAVMSGQGRDLDRERSRSAGFVDHLVKPVRFTTLRDLIDRVLAGRGPVAGDDPPIRVD